MAIRRKGKEHSIPRKAFVPVEEGLGSSPPNYTGQVCGFRGPVDP